MTFPPLLTGLCAALVLSLAGNGILARAYLKQRDTTAQALAQAERNLDVARQCSAGVRSLEIAADEQRKASKVSIDAAHAKAEEARRRAAANASRPATRPGDDCGSAQDRIDQWMRQR